MRFQSIDLDINKDELKAVLEWISSSGEGTIGGPNDGHAMIDIFDDLLIKNTENSVASIVNSMYPSFSENINDPSYLQERSILPPTLDFVESINEYVISLNRTEENTYLSSNATCKSDSNIVLIGDLHTPEFLNAIKCSGMLNHQLKLKVGVPVMLLRNVDHSSGLCNGTRLVITRLGNHVLERKVISGSNAGFKVFISRMTLTPLDPRLHFKFKRRQYPLVGWGTQSPSLSQGKPLCPVGCLMRNGMVKFIKEKDMEYISYDLVELEEENDPLHLQSDLELLGPLLRHRKLKSIEYYEEEEDRISELPDQILVRLVFFLPLKEALATMSGQDIDYLLSKCSALERSKVSGSIRLVTLRVSGPSLSLKVLEIYFCKEIKRIEILDAQNLVSFYLDCSEKPPLELLIGNVPRLVTVRIRLREFDYVPRAFTMLLCCISQLQILQLDVVNAQRDMKNRVYPMLTNLRQLNLILNQYDRYNLVKIIPFMKASAYLEKLVLKLCTTGIGNGKSQLRKVPKIQHYYLKSWEGGRVILIKHGIGISDQSNISYKMSDSKPGKEMKNCESRFNKSKAANYVGTQSL
ncbi:hypothetical protein FEM48_Zijuj02G0081700 [Ziziphus jujuba var. spinosa]|uniref:DNA helicase n=1 Tax=Ziziphus jujuba var. spinosa TaxID=714518 RepID=A0A978VUL6_ZIZJJ|nr:hypothetical protein FEM48_Zijuj02G0081700 [Ziziphus jujuba var. spinosa]